MAGISDAAQQAAADGSGNPRLRIDVTGEADKTVRWVATVHMTEVG